MKVKREIKRSRAQESSAAIEQLYISMRHLFNRGYYRPMGVSGLTLRENLIKLRPEIYGSIADSKVELNGLLYVIDRLPEGIEACRNINLTSDEGLSASHFKVIIPKKRRRNCYRIDKDQMVIEITRGRSDIYDILTHLTFIYNESEKIKKNAWDSEKKETSNDWRKLEKLVERSCDESLSIEEKEQAIAYLSNLTGRTFEQITKNYQKFSLLENPDRFIELIFNLGRLAIEEDLLSKKRTITFSRVLRERIGHHIYGEKWANRIKKELYDKGLIDRPLHIISANMHSVLNSLFAHQVLQKKLNKQGVNLYKELSSDQNKDLQDKVFETAKKQGMIFLKDNTATNIDVQLFDTKKIDWSLASYKKASSEDPVILVMDYAFGEQAFETIDELLKPFQKDVFSQTLDVRSISVMGKAGILVGQKGDIMLANAHVNEGTADNYPFENQLSIKDFEKDQVNVFQGTMITVIGTSLQNKDILEFFKKSTWKAIGLEMEGAHYQKAIQAASKIRKSINPQIKVNFAYYASDNPLETGSTLSSGGLGTSGVKPTYLITDKILKQIV